MITYRKKSLKVRNIYASADDGDYDRTYSHRAARGLKKFIENGAYGRIVDVFIYGETNESLMCSIIYEELKEK